MTGYQIREVDNSSWIDQISYLVLSEWTNEVKNDKNYWIQIYLRPCLLSSFQVFANRSDHFIYRWVLWTKTNLPKMQKVHWAKKEEVTKILKFARRRSNIFFFVMQPNKFFFLYFLSFRKKIGKWCFFLLLKFRQNQQTSKVNWAEAVAHLARRLLPAHEDSSSNPNIGKNLCVNCLL